MGYQTQKQQGEEKQVIQNGKKLKKITIENNDYLLKIDINDLNPETKETNVPEMNLVIKLEFEGEEK